MLVNEILTESIRYSKYIHGIEDAIYKGILQVLQDITSRDYERHQAEIDENIDFQPMVNFLRYDLEKRLRYRVIEKLEDIAADIILPPDLQHSRIPVDIQDIGFEGIAAGMSVQLNDKFLKELVEHLINLIYNSVLDNWYTQDSYFDFIFRHLKNSKYWLDMLPHDSKISDHIRYWSKVFVHELAHVAQHQRQFEKKLSSTEYRSYLDRYKGEFIQLFKPDTLYGEKWRDYHKASPQEIDAFAQEIAVEIISYYYSSPRDIDFSDTETLKELYHSVPSNVERFWRKPVTAVDKKVFQRYVRRVVANITDYLQHYKSKSRAE